jgi:hypothetical protein
MRVFISYSWEDKKLSDTICNSVTSVKGAVAVRDDSFGSSSFLKQIEAAIRSCDVFLVAWTENSLASHWVKAEALEALDLGKPILQLAVGVRPPFGFKEFNPIRPENIAIELENMRNSSAYSTTQLTESGRDEIQKLKTAYTKWKSKLSVDMTPEEAFEAMGRNGGAHLKSFVVGRKQYFRIAFAALGAFALGYGAREWVGFSRLEANPNDPRAVRSIVEQFPLSVAGGAARSRLSTLAVEGWAQASATDDVVAIDDFVVRWSDPGLEEYASAELAAALARLKSASLTCVEVQIAAATESKSVEVRTQRLAARTSGMGEARASRQRVCAAVPEMAIEVNAVYSFPSASRPARTQHTDKSDNKADGQRNICATFEVRSQSGMNHMNEGVDGIGQLQVTYVLPPTPDAVGVIEARCRLRPEWKPSTP